MEVLIPFEKVSHLPGPEAVILAEKFDDFKVTTVQWDSGGSDIYNPLKQRPVGLYVIIQEKTVFVNLDSLVETIRRMP